STVQLDQEIISCPICLDLLKDPVTTPCGHSYCKNCINDHWDTEDEKRIYSCPQCRKSFIPRPELLKNTTVSSFSGGKLQENICSRHDEVMKMFCRTDQQCICYLCSVEEHKGHDTVSAAQRIQNREEDVKVLQQEVEQNEKIFTQLIRLMEERRSDVKQQVRSQQETEVSRVKELQEKLEQEITELKRKDAELKKLSHTEDHSQFLHNYPSLSALSELLIVTVGSHLEGSL
uniref:RING-type domain-containing protein n=1 Tax=Sparus aurata TaxID=8175 RepID=A0A671UNT2_SPAAU